MHRRNIKGHPWNHKRIKRIDCAPDQNLRIGPRKRLQRDKPDALAVPDAPNMTWSVEFAAPSFGSGLTCWEMGTSSGWRTCRMISTASG